MYPFSFGSNFSQFVLIENDIDKLYDFVYFNDVNLADTHV